MPTQLVSKGATHTRGKTTTTTTTTTTTQKKKSTGSVRTMARFAVAASAPAGAVTSSPGVQTRSRSKGGGGGGGGGYTRYRVSAKSSAKPVDGDLKKRKETIFTIPTILTLARMFAIPFVVLGKKKKELFFPPSPLLSPLSSFHSIILVLSPILTFGIFRNTNLNCFK